MCLVLSTARETSPVSRFMPKRIASEGVSYSRLKSSNRINKFGSVFGSSNFLGGDFTPAYVDPTSVSAMVSLVLKGVVV